MATTKRRQLTDEERAQRRRQEQQLTTRAVAQLRCSDGWQPWLRVRGRLGLRRYTVFISGPSLSTSPCCWARTLTTCR
jgi:hypothetical protein